MKIDINRLMNDIGTYATYGADDQGGVTRPSFSAADYEVRKKFIRELEEMGLSVRVDAIANIWGTYNGQTTRPPIVIGSHLDTVPNGGKYDGALGVLAAKEVIQTLIDYNVTLNHPLEIVSFTAEEPNDFNLSTMGSRTLIGKLDQETLLKTTDSTGRRLKDAVAKAGGSLDKLPMSRQDLTAFIELHIEQGKRLESANIPIGIVDNIVGIYRDQLKITGVANHAGTTMMQDRTDALTAASEVVLAVEDVLRDQDSDAVATVGKFDVSPNAANIIPGKVELIIEIRSRSAKERRHVRDKMYECFEEIAKKRNVAININNILDQQECDFDPDIVRALEDTANEMDIRYTTFSSMAGHDATHVANIAKTAMLFVKSIDGISHSPKEYSMPEDIERAANVLLQAVMKIDAKLSEQV